MTTRAPQTRSENGAPRRAGSSAVYLLTAIALGALATGCASRPPQRPTALAESSPGGTWEVVFSGPLVADAGPLPQGREYARLDAHLNRRDVSIYPLDSWPDEPRPSLYLSRRITIPTSSESIQFYGTARRDPGYPYYYNYWYR